MILEEDEEEAEEEQDEEDMREYTYDDDDTDIAEDSPVGEKPQILIEDRSNDDRNGNECEMENEKNLLERYYLTCIVKEKRIGIIYEDITS